MKKYIVASFLDNTPAGTVFAESTWPLHVTLMRSLFSDCDEEDLITLLKEALVERTSFTLVGKSEQLFGPHLDRPVIELERTAQIHTLNTTLKEKFAHVIDQSIPDKYPEYRPHVTRQIDGGIAVGSVVTVGSVSLIRCDLESRCVLTTVDLA